MSIILYSYDVREMVNFEQIILLLVSGQGSLLSFALLSGLLKKNYSNFFLGLITMVITLEILHIWGISMGYHSSKYVIPFWLFGSYLITPPAVWLFMQLNTQPTFQPKPKHFFLFLPAVLEISIEVPLYYGNKIFGTDYRLELNSIWHTFTEEIPVIVMIIVLFSFAKKLKILNTRLKIIKPTKSSFSQLSKLYFFFLVFSFLTIFWLLVSVFNFQLYPIIEVILLLFIFILGYINYFNPTFNTIPKVLKKDIIKEKFPQFYDKKELERLNALFEYEKIFRQQKLTLNEVATILDLPERYISGLINTYHNTNFNTFVNTFRVTDTIKRIKDPKEKNKSILGIALESGFSSKSAFNGTFKTITGKNPSDFLDK
ncbi:helix-turn-helix domain-containing protein [uncultured Maribacter sp.]|uniref:helix-turn-helix domain-containing protein n=1 Tax=uncultured Maribacter sp. TaxID=431308 RepID=UPI00262B77AF|nr:helix-turn-helix domain-containing protein [uncultured Maribacter sp.]